MYNTINALINLNENILFENESKISLFSINNKDGINDTIKYMITIQIDLPFPTLKKIFKTAFNGSFFFISPSPLRTILIVHYKNYNKILSSPLILYGCHLLLFPHHLQTVFFQQD